MSPNLKVAYFLGRFPELTKTFVTREIYWIRKQDVDVSIFSLFRPQTITIHERDKELLPYVHYGRVLFRNVIKAQLHFLRHTPKRYFRALAKTIQYSHREPKVLLRALSIFPKSVYFAWEMKDKQIQHVHAHFITLASIAANITCILLDIPLSIHAHAVGLFTRNQASVRRQLEDASKIITISNYHRDYIANLCSHIDVNNVEIVYCSLEAGEFQPTSKQPDKTNIRILSVGRLIEKKGFEYLIDACVLLARRGVTFQCQIVGQGPLQAALQARIDQHQLQKSVALLGPLEQARVLDLYQTSDIFALACVVARNGNQDGLPVVLTEAMACELPVVTTPVAGITDLITDRKNGLLVQERDASGLADALENLIADEPLRRQLGKQARQKILQEFQIQHNAAKLATIFREVSRQHPIQI